MAEVVLSPSRKVHYGPREQDGNALSEFAAQLFCIALDNGAFPVCESSAPSGRYPKQWDLPCSKTVLSRPDAEWADFPMCAFGLGPPDAANEFYIHMTWLVFPKHLPLRQALLRHCPDCPGVSNLHRHVALKGSRDGTSVTRCTKAGAYAWEFVRTVVAALQA